ncbi:Fungalysin metallopeptidase-domain-containing protein [Panaeolus papilionaceus]|nr:Fungalysin metallopeptidase-domain-containing protein [Panaeolus papilionaceus]
MCRLAPWVIQSTMPNLRVSVFLLLLFLQCALTRAYFIDQDNDLDHEDFLDEEMTLIAGDLDPPAITVDYFHPEVQYSTYDNDEEPFLLMDTSLGDDAVRVSALDFVQQTLAIDPHQVIYQSGYSSDDVHYTYVAQAQNGIPFINAVANVAIHAGRVVSFGSSFVQPISYAAPNPTVPLERAIATAEAQLHGTYNNHPVSLNYLARADNTAALVYTIQVENDALSLWYEAHVDAHTGAVHSAVNFVDESMYRAVPIDRQSILDGTRRIRNPQNYEASRLGWHNDGERRRTRTQGNNVLAHRHNRTTRQSSRRLRFNYRYDTRRRPSHRRNIRASTTNAFYVMNAVHDFTYLYGFTEKAFNFQHTNFGLGGKDKDSVTVSVQDPTRVNNANFATPPDGQPGRAKFFIYDGWRDSAMDNSLLVHEYTHGITNRMTGGGTARCLKANHSRGLGEGWSDAMADWTEQRGPTIRDLIQGVYVKNNFERGIRHYPYSVDKKINPLLFSHLNKLSEVHAVGEIWANVLHQVHTLLVQHHGFSYNARSNPNTQHGNVVFLHLFIDALALQPCNPNFLQARDAWFRADKNRYRGRHRCLLWKAFAFRGMGVDAKGATTPPYVDSFKVPKGC